MKKNQYDINLVDPSLTKSSGKRKRDGDTTAEVLSSVGELASLVPMLSKRSKEDKLYLGEEFISPSFS